VADAPYKGNVFIVDAIVCNPGSHGGVLTTRKGELIGLIGKELRNNLTETWVNYAMPVKDLAYFVDKAKKGEYKQMEVKSTQDIVNKNAYHGLILVPKILDRTPPYVDEVDFDSPAGRAGVKPDDLIMFVRLPARDGTGAMEELQVNHTDALQDVLAPLDPGSKIELIVRRSQQLLRMEFTLEKSRGGPPAVAKPPMKLRELD
jgi:serine protease Do